MIRSEITMSSMNINLQESLKKYIDFDKNNKIIYCNYFLDEFKVVLKVPIVLGGKKIEVLM